MALRRLRNLALLMLPYAAGLLVLPLIMSGVREPDRIGLAAVAIAPAWLAGQDLAGRAGARMDRVGALLAGSIGVSCILALVRGGAIAATAQTAMLAFVVGAGITSGLPMLPDRVRTVVRWLGTIGALVLIAMAVVRFDEIGSATFIAALVLFGVTTLTAALVSWIGGVDVRSALLSAGTRDPAAATALAIGAGGATVVPVLSVLPLALIFASLAILNRRKPG